MELIPEIPLKSKIIAMGELIPAEVGIESILKPVVRAYQIRPTSYQLGIKFLRIQPQSLSEKIKLFIPSPPKEQIGQLTGNEKRKSQKRLKSPISYSLKKKEVLRGHCIRRTR